MPQASAFLPSFQDAVVPCRQVLEQESNYSPVPGALRKSRSTASERTPLAKSQRTNNWLRWRRDLTPRLRLFYPQSIVREHYRIVLSFLQESQAIHGQTINYSKGENVVTAGTITSMTIITNNDKPAAPAAPAAPSAQRKISETTLA